MEEMKPRKDRQFNDIADLLNPVLDADGNPVLDKNGNVVMETDLGMPVLLVSVDEMQTKTGAEYCRCAIRSMYSKMEVSANLWNRKKSVLIAEFPEKSPVWVELQRQTYRNQPTYSIKGISQAPAGVSIDDFLQISKYSPSAMLNSMYRFLDYIRGKNPDFVPCKIVTQLYADNEEKLLYWPAAKSIHHNCYGGLTYHNFRQALMAYYITELYEPSFANKKIYVDAETCINTIFEFCMQKHGEISDLVVSAYNKYRDVLLANEDELQRIVRRMYLGNCLLHDYEGDEEIVYAGIALRPLGRLVCGSDEFKMSFIGPEMATLELLDEILAYDGGEIPERILALKHCICSYPANGIDPAIASPAVRESFLTYGAELLDKSLSDENFNGHMLICATMLHDIGKLLEFNADKMGNGEYSPAGNLLGHLAMGTEMVNAEIRKHPEWIASEEDLRDVEMLKHCILSHHNKLEWGAVVEPRTPEARAMFALDYIDSRMYTVDQSEKRTIAGAMDESTSFALRARLYRPFYRDAE